MHKKILWLKPLAIFFAGTLLISVSSTGWAEETIDFEITGGVYKPSDVYTQYGFNITFGNFFSHVGDWRTDFYIIGGSTCYPPCATDGTNVLYSFNAASSFTISSTDGSLFNITSLDAASPVSGWSAGVHMLGISLDGPDIWFESGLLGNSFQTIQLPESFRNTQFQSISFFGGNGYGYNSFAVDNIQVRHIASITEPETYAMLLAGLGLLGFTARRRKQYPA